MKDRVCIVTGATSGIGRAAALELARRGARVAVHGRSRERCDETVASIRADSGNDAVEPFVADLASQEQIRSLAGALLARYSSIHVLVNNAGLLNQTFRETVDGIEATLAVNHLAPFLLTNLLLDRLVQSQPSRIVNVASEAHRYGTLDLDDLEFRRRGYAGLKAYGVSKQLNLLFTNALAHRLKDTRVTVNAMHPGVVSTGLGTNNTPSLLVTVMGFVRFLMRTPDKGAETAVYLASSTAVESVNGGYWIDCRQKRARAISYDQKAPHRLWELSERLTGLA